MRIPTPTIVTPTPTPSPIPFVPPAIFPWLKKPPAGWRVRKPRVRPRIVERGKYVPSLIAKEYGIREPKLEPYGKLAIGLRPLKGKRRRERLPFAFPEVKI